MVRYLSAFIAILAGSLAALAAGGPGALLFDMAKEGVTVAPGTGAISLSTAVVGFQTFTASGAVNGNLLSYSVVDTAGTWEVGRGTFLTSASGATLTRSPLWGSSGANTAITMTTNAVVTVAVLQEDLLIGETTGTLAQRFGSTPQSFFTYNTATTGIPLGANYERGSACDWNSTANVCTIGAEQGGAGVQRQVLTTSYWAWQGSLQVALSSFSTSTTANAKTQYFLCMDSTTTTLTVALPGSPATGLTFLIKDCTGQAATHAIIISPSTGNIDGSANSIMTTTFGSQAVTYNGTQWSIN